MRISDWSSDVCSSDLTTAHAVMRLNRQDGGARQSISVTNNEVAAEEQNALRLAALRPGDADWEKWGICDYITKPRIAAAISGERADGGLVAEEYRFGDIFPMKDGLEENAAFFTLTYESPIAVDHNLAFARVAPLLWLRAGASGAMIDSHPEAGWAVAETYALIIDLDESAAFLAMLASTTAVRHAFIVTNDERRFQAVAQQLPGSVEPVRLYESYLTNFRFCAGDGA